MDAKRKWYLEYADRKARENRESYVVFSTKWRDGRQFWAEPLYCAAQFVRDEAELETDRLEYVTA